jgi:transcription termination factor Rho
MSSEDETPSFVNQTASIDDAPNSTPKPARKRAVKKTAAKKAAKKATKKAAKKAAKKKVARKAAKSADAAQPELFAESSPASATPAAPAPRAEPAFVPAEIVPGEVNAATAKPKVERVRKPSVVWSSDDPDPAPESSQESRSEPVSVEGAHSSAAEAGDVQGASAGEGPSKDGKPQGRRNEHGGGHRNPRRERAEHGDRNPRGDRPNRNGKFNKNKGGPGPHPNARNKKKGKGRWQDKKKRAREDESPIEFGELLEFETLRDFDALLALAAELRSGEGEVLDFNTIYDMSLPALRGEVAAAEVETTHAPNRDQLLNALVAQAGEQKRGITSVGIFEPLEEDEGGVLVYERDSYRVKALCAYVPQLFVERYGLQRGHIVKAQLHPHRENESCPFVVCVNEVMGRDPETLSEIVPFTEGVPYYPLERILMESDTESKSDNLSMRVVDCLTPVGFGQRGLIVAPPRTGKTVLMQGMANSIQKNYPDAHLIILLIDERPEEVTDFRRQVSGEVISSTFDESAESHVHCAEMVIEKARRMVEVGKDVVILLDSITRLARAYNTTMPSSGKILSGGVEANALQKPKRFFGSARNIEDGGSLTIIATALVETGSKMDEVIFEEFKGTGNMELHLDRGLSDKRIFPALSMDKSGTRKEELLYHPDEMLKIYSLRRAMKGLPSTDAMEMLIQRIKKTNTNAEFLMSVSR